MTSAQATNQADGPTGTTSELVKTVRSTEEDT